MNTVDVHELLKAGLFSGVLDWLKAAKLVSYGVVEEVIDAQTVRVVETVKSSASEGRYLATVLAPSSALFEGAVLPQVGDPVLLLFLQKYHPAMFDLHREAADAVIYDTGAEGYNSHAAVALLLTPLKGNSATKLLFGGTAEEPELTLTTAAEVMAQVRRAFFLFFDDEGEEEAPLTALFGRYRPLTTDHRGTVLRRHGFMVDTVERELLETEAAVREEYSIYAPITRDIQGAQTVRVGIGTDPGGDPEGAAVETEAPITETVHGKSPITKDLRSPITVKIGIGNEESGDAEEQREAPVEVELGEHAPITATSKSGMTLHFDKPVVIDGAETWDLTVTGAITITGEDALSVTIAKAVDFTAHDQATVTVDKAVDLTVHDQATVTVDKAVDLTVHDKLTAAVDGQVTVDTKAKVYIGSPSSDLYTLLANLITQIKNLKTFGSPGMHTVDPSSVAALTLFQQTYLEPLFTAGK